MHLNKCDIVPDMKWTGRGENLPSWPGLIDAHLHFESQLANPTALAEAMVPCGTTTIFAECLDLLSAAGEDGVQAAKDLFRDYHKLPYRLFAFAPDFRSRLPPRPSISHWPRSSWAVS